jgi:hypothetical protein
MSAACREGHKRAGQRKAKVESGLNARATDLVLGAGLIRADDETPRGSGHADSGSCGKTDEDGIA